MTPFQVSVWCLTLLLSVNIPIEVQSESTKDAPRKLTGDSSKDATTERTSYIPNDAPREQTRNRPEESLTTAATNIQIDRNNFTCPQVCINTCNKRVECFAKDHTGNISTTFQNIAKRKGIQNLAVVQNNGVLPLFDDYLSCYDAEKLLTFYSKYSQDIEAKIEPDESSGDLPSVDIFQPFLPYLQLVKDFVLDFWMEYLSYDSKVLLCRQLSNLDCRVQIFFMRRVDIREFCEKGVESAQSIRPTPDLIRMFLIDTYGEMKTWNLTIWENVVQHMDIMESDKDFVEMFPDELLFKMLKMSPQGCKSISSKKSLQIIQDKLMKVLEQSKNDPKKTTEVATLLQSCGGNVKDISKYATNEQMLKTYSTSTAVTVSERDKAYMRSILKEEKSDPSQMTNDDIIKFASLIMNDQKLLNSLNKTALEEAICGIGSQVTEINQARKLKSILETLDNYNDLATYTKEKIVCLKGLLGILSPSQIEELPSIPLGEAIVEGSLKDVLFPCQVAREVLKKYNTYLGKEDGNLAANEITQLPGSIKICFGPSEIERLSVDALTLEVIKDFISEYEKRKITGSESTVRKIIQKIMGDTTILSALAATSWAKYIPSSLLRKSVNMGQQIADQLQAGEPITFKTDCPKSKFFYSQLTRVIGPPSPDNFNWTTTVFRALQESNILSGMPLEHLMNISSTLIFEVADSFLASDCITGNQKEIIMEKFLAEQVINTSSITPADIQNMDPTILFNQNVEDLQKYGEENKEAVCMVLGQISINEVPMNQVLEKAQFCSHCINAESLSNENVTKCGALTCALPEDNIDRMDAEALTEHAADLAVNCRWVQSQRQKLIDAIMHKDVIQSAVNMTDVDIMTIKTLIADMPPDEFDLIPMEAFNLADTAIVAAFKAREELQKELVSKGFMNSWTDDDWTQQTEGTTRVFTKIIEIKLSAGSRRKKREANNSTLTCDTLKMLDTVGLPSVPVKVLSNLAETDFQDCMLLLGQVTKWSSEQKAALAFKMKTVFGIPSNWTSETIGTAGTMLQGLSASEIETLQLDTDSMSVLGQISGWSREQESSGFKAFMRSAKADDSASSLSSTEIVAIRNFLCGMPPSEIKTIHASVYVDAADVVGGLVQCTNDQLKAWAVLAKDVNGYGSDITLWSVTTVSNVGIVIGGLSQNDISSLSRSQIDSIDGKYISYIPVVTFSYFTAEQLGHFSQTQAQATTKEQRATIDCQRFNSLSDAAGITWEEKKMFACSTGTTVSMALSLFVCVILMFIL